MSISHIKITSKEMEKVKRFVHKMSKSMVFDKNMEKISWVKARRRNNIFFRLMPKMKKVKFKRVAIGNCGAMLVTPETVDESKIIIYYHGGGFVTGSAFVSKSYTSMLAKFSGYKVYAVEYSLAPEHKYPRGFNDCCLAYENIAKMHPNSKIIILGESAGGNYSLSVALRYKDEKNISCVVVHSPIVDFSDALDHSVNENKDFIVKLDSMKPLKNIYLSDTDVKNSFLSPYYGDFANFPPTFITCDINETLYADSKALYEKCVSSGVCVKMIEAEGGYHAFAVSGTNTPETMKILEETVSFMSSN